MPWRLCLSARALRRVHADLSAHHASVSIGVVGVSPPLVEQTRHVVVFHEGASARQALSGELLRGDACAQYLFRRAHGGDDAAFLGREGLDALRAGGRLGLEQRRVEVHQAIIARDQRDVALLLEHLGVAKLERAFKKLHDLTEGVHTALLKSRVFESLNAVVEDADIDALDEEITRSESTKAKNEETVAPASHEDSLVKPLKVVAPSQSGTAAAGK